MWIYCARNRTDGIVPVAYARSSLPKRLREALTTAGCWHERTCTTNAPCRHGACTTTAACGQQVLVMRDYARHQPTHRRPDTPGRDPRPYIKLSVDFLENHRTGPLSPVAKLTLIELWIYCHRNHTNGVLPLPAFRRIAPARIRDALLAAGSCRQHECTPTRPCRHGACTMAAPCRHGVATMHDYHRHQPLHMDSRKQRQQSRSDSKSEKADTAAENRESTGAHAGGTTPDSVSLTRASQKLEVKEVCSSVGIPPPVSNAREENEKHGPPPTTPRTPPPVRVAPRARHGGDGVADRLNAAAPEVPATPAMRQRVLARLAPNAVAVLADPDTDPIRRERAHHELARAEAVIDARAEYLKTGDLNENREADWLFDPYGDNGAMRRMLAAQRPLPTPDPVTVGERRAMAFRLAGEHIDTLTGYGARPPGTAREAMRAELEALLEAGVSQDVLRSELRAMLEAGLWAASKLRERIAEARP
ncbi:hypothetical protein [Nocardia arizonensis]|uniref:hypothetical protein n=1 Tax=Nocardia arizonensis TaxID=1141647 RepID=UPI000A894E50|nr:hypothetical protein [Nocardia arizonensis]